MGRDEDASASRGAAEDAGSDAGGAAEGARELPTLRDLATLVAAERTARRVPYEDMAKRAGMSPVTWRRVEMDAMTVRPLSYSGVEQVLEWPSGSIRAYLAGGPEPKRIEQPAHEPSARSIREFSWDELMDEVDRRYREAIASGSSPSARAPLAPLDTEETAESVSARGMIPGRRMKGEGTGDEGVASGGQA